MRDFSYSVAERIDDAFAADGRDTMAIAGGTELLNWFRLGIAAPTVVIDIGRLRGLDVIERQGDRLSIGALATLNQVGEHPLVQAHAAVLGEACVLAASAQIRNRATLGGNVLQKTRCSYFRAEAPLAWGCNRRAPGTGCAALDGHNDRHAILGWSAGCVATQPSDPLVALAALDATVEFAGPGGRRSLPVANLHVTPEETGDPAAETRMRSGEMIFGYQIPVRDGARSAYVKVRERASYEYALVSAAATLVLDGGRIAEVSLALGSVAMKPWRLPSAEAALIGQAPTRDAARPAITAALSNARPLAHNRYKIAMAIGAAVRAIVEAGEKA